MSIQGAAWWDSGSQSSLTKSPSWVLSVELDHPLCGLSPGDAVSSPGRKEAFFSKPFFLFQSWGCRSLPQSHHSSLMVLNVPESMCVALLQTGNLSGCSPPSANSRWDRIQQQISQKC